MERDANRSEQGWLPVSLLAVAATLLVPALALPKCPLIPPETLDTRTDQLTRRTQPVT